jgi:hypothetical protein
LTSLTATQRDLIRTALSDLRSARVQWLNNQADTKRLGALGQQEADERDVILQNKSREERQRIIRSGPIETSVGQEIRDIQSRNDASFQAVWAVRHALVMALQTSDRTARFVSMVDDVMFDQNSDRFQWFASALEAVIAPRLGKQGVHRNRRAGATVGASPPRKSISRATEVRESVRRIAAKLEAETGRKPSQQHLCRRLEHDRCDTPPGASWKKWDSSNGAVKVFLSKTLT